MDVQPGSSAETGERYAYFMVRIQTNADTRARTAGVIERLGTGRKQSFSSIDELVRLLTDGSADVQNMGTGAVTGNESTVTAEELQPFRYAAPNNPPGEA